ncbi:hypothetical protein CEE36_11025 [candidate division TA06 bacterium B3_TA06]|uniref:Secretion system C-terminal sorting domain-containing protein n=1 Tax=candidate division TA06 bacterium B3_TA06 TaxID=2012487 RepID=A0A532URS4_UNCT6|nr:MAG: hypothetical protein CEE36_11025 [candidate division TA06 bacterium B3_TA06]
MKRFAFLGFLPVALFALEPVNLIKDGGFEKDSEVWLERSKIINGPGNYDSTIYNYHDPDSAYIGDYCGSIDGRKKPFPNLPEGYGIEGYFYQIIPYPKPLKDLDSLEFFHMALFRDEGVKSSAGNYGVVLYLTRPSGVFIEVWYGWLRPGSTPAPDTPTRKIFSDTIPDEGVWYGSKRNLKADLIGEKGLSEDIELDTFLLYECSWLVFSVWRGQKAFFDGVRLTGYADYDVGVKEILSGDSLREGHPYTPEARIKNFGREPADSFLVIAEIWDTSGLAYADTLPWSLEGDTEDIASFADFTPQSSGSYTLTIRTVMEPDESDEDDALSKFLIYTGIEEPVTPVTHLITLQVRSFTDPLCVSYSIPQGQQGTLSLYDAAGRRIERVNVRGSGSVDFSSTLPSDVYFVRLGSADLTITRKAVLLR